MTEEAKMVEEIAKTTGKALEVAEKAGGFIAKYIGGSLEQGMGIFEDKLKYLRWERQQRLMIRANEFMKNLGYENPDKFLKMKHAIPLLQAATLEEDDYLQDLWAALLVNSTIEATHIELTRTYIDILERLSHLEAQILEIVYNMPFEEIQHQGVLTAQLPNSANIAEDKSNYEKLTNEEVILAIANLSRWGCISPARSFGGGEIFSIINPTLLGKYFVEACTLRTKE